MRRNKWNLKIFVIACGYSQCYPSDFMRPTNYSNIHTAECLERGGK